MNAKKDKVVRSLGYWYGSPYADVDISIPYGNEVYSTK